MASAETLATIKEIIRDELPIDEDVVITDDLPLLGGGMELDSLDVLLLLTSLEKALGIKLTGGTLREEAFASVRSLAERVDELRAQDAPSASVVAAADPAVALGRLPHGPEFRFLSALDELEPGVAGRGRWRLTGEEAFFAGHFPGRPVVPGVLIGEALAQLSGLVADGGGAGASLAQLELRWRRPVTPPAELTLHSRQLAAADRLRRFAVRAELAGTTVAEGELALALDADATDAAAG